MGGTTRAARRIGAPAAVGRAAPRGGTVSCGTSPSRFRCAVGRPPPFSRSRLATRPREGPNPREGAGTVPTRRRPGTAPVRCRRRSYRVRASRDTEQAGAWPAVRSAGIRCAVTGPPRQVRRRRGSQPGSSGDTGPVRRGDRDPAPPGAGRLPPRTALRPPGRGGPALARGARLRRRVTPSPGREPPVRADGAAGSALCRAPRRTVCAPGGRDRGLRPAGRRGTERS